MRSRNPSVISSKYWVLRYYFFGYIAHGQANKQLQSYEYISKWFDSWIASKDEHSTMMIFELYQKDGKELSLAMGNMLNSSSAAIFHNQVHYHQRKRELSFELDPRFLLQFSFTSGNT